MRLNRYLAAAGLGSRRACEEFIRSGEVTINGERIADLAAQVGPEDVVRLRGKPVRARPLVYLALNKPKGVLSTCADTHRRRTVLDLVPRNFGRLFHVGRLDKESEGLILLTNDGDLAQRLSHPAHNVDKEYEVILDRPFDPTHIRRLLTGVHIEGGKARMASVFILSSNKIKVVLRQGIKRQIRLMLRRVGKYEVKTLRRTRKIGRAHV